MNLKEKNIKTAKRNQIKVVFKGDFNWHIGFLNNKQKDFLRRWCKKSAN